MLANRDFIVFADDWGYYPSTMQHIGRVLAAHNRLLWIGSLGLRRPEFSLKDARRAWGKFRKMMGKGRTAASTGAALPPGVFPLHPAVLPLHDIALVRGFNMVVLRRTVLSACRRHGMSHPVLLTSSPLVAPLLGRLGESSSHYICLDDFTKFDGAFDCIGPLEQRMLGSVSSVFSVSEILRRSRMPASRESHFLPQGVDTAHFAPANEPLPGSVAALPKPVIGFFGLLTSWVDRSLFVRIARAYPNCTVAVIGRAAVDVSDLQGVPNLVYLGEVPYTELPRYARAFDVGLIPFVVNELTRAANPLKLLEYLSLGIPVVSTDLPEARRFENVVLIARTNDEFVGLVGQALADCSPEGAARRRALAQDYSWTTLVDKMVSVIERIEGMRSPL